MVDLQCYNVEIKKHVFDRAVQRGIHPDMIESVLK